MRTARRRRRGGQRERRERERKKEQVELRCDDAHVSGRLSDASPTLSIDGAISVEHGSRVAAFAATDSGRHDLRSCFVYRLWLRQRRTWPRQQRSGSAVRAPTAAERMSITALVRGFWRAGTEFNFTPELSHRLTPIERGFRETVTSIRVSRLDPRLAVARAEVRDRSGPPATELRRRVPPATRSRRLGGTRRHRHRVLRRLHSKRSRAPGATDLPDPVGCARDPSSAAPRVRVQGRDHQALAGRPRFPARSVAATSRSASEAG